MADQVQNSGFLQMPLLVIERILSNIHNPSNVSRTCKYLYEIVCDMEKHRRVMFIRGSGTTTKPTRFTIDDDAVFDSIMNTYRTIDEIKLYVEWLERDPLELNERQLERMTAIMKQFAANITNFELKGITLSINSILEWLHQTPKLESLTFASGSCVGPCTDKASLWLQLPSLKTLETFYFDGLLDIVNLIPPGSLNNYHYFHNQSTEIPKAILTKQQNIKSLDYHDSSDDPDLTVLRVNNLQLERLKLNFWCEDYNEAEFVEILKCHTNLKELILPENQNIGSAFKWICNNLKNLEVFEVTLTESQQSYYLKMLGELKKLRHFRTKYSELLCNELQFKSDSLEKLEIADDMSTWHGEPLNNLVHVIVQSFTNLTALEIHLGDFSELTFVLSHCTTLTHLTSSLRDTSSDKLTQQRFPNIKHLTLHTNPRYNLEVVQQRNEISPSMCLIVQAMPNLKNLNLTLCRSVNDDVMFDVNQMKEVIKDSKHLEYLYLHCFELHLDDFIETIRCLLDQLKACILQFNAGESKLPSDEFYVYDNDKTDDDDDDGAERLYLYKNRYESLQRLFNLN